MKETEVHGGLVKTLEPGKCCFCGTNEKENGEITHPHRKDCPLINGTKKPSGHELFTEIFDTLRNINPPPAVNRADYIHYENRCYTATQKIIKLL